MYHLNRIKICLEVQTVIKINTAPSSHSGLAFSTFFFKPLCTYYIWDKNQKKNLNLLTQMHKLRLRNLRKGSSLTDYKMIDCAKHMKNLVKHQFM